MEITSRQKQILEWVANEYIRSAKPISSQLLEEKYKLGVCPATIRIEMQKLTQMGYLYQPHTSAGRIPTDRAYRYLVDDLLNKKAFDLFEDLLIEIVKEEESNLFEWLSRLTKTLAEISSGFVVAYLKDNDFFSKEGWEKVLKEPEFEKREMLFDFARFVESFEKEIESLDLNSEIKVYIGEENPFPAGKNFSIVSAHCKLPKGKKGIISIVGPKRMWYKKNIDLVKSLINVLENI